MHRHQANKTTPHPCHPGRRTDTQPPPGELPRALPSSPEPPPTQACLPVWAPVAAGARAATWLSRAPADSDEIRFFIHTWLQGGYQLGCLLLLVSAVRGGSGNNVTASGSISQSCRSLAADLTSPVTASSSISQS